jgi:hypothetical protein
MKFTWKGKWKKGEIIIEAESLEELENALKTLSSEEEMREFSEAYNVSIPKITTVENCAGAIRALMRTDWGQKPRSMIEIKKALEANALYFSKGTLSGTLTAMVKRGEFRRMKEEGRWKYLTKNETKADRNEDKEDV